LKVLAEVVPVWGWLWMSRVKMITKSDLNGIELLAGKSLNSFLDGQVIDFVNSGMREGFVISPEYGSSCS
jgi:Fe-S cluster assembly iron-binding protein IscA